MPSFKACNMDKAAATLLTVAVFLMTLWRFGANQCFALVAIMVVLYRPWRQELFSWKWIKTPVISVGLVLLVWAVISVSYSETPTIMNALEGLRIYSKILFLLVLPIALRASKYRKWIENGLIYGVLINVIISTLYYYHLPFMIHYFASYMSMDITFTVNPLQVIFVVVLAIWFLALRLMNREGGKIDVLVLILLMGYLWFINMERSGYLIFIALLILFLAQYFGKKAVLAGCIAIPLALFLLYEASPNIKGRVDLGIHNVVAYQQAQSAADIGPDNSLGLRLAFISESQEIIQHHLFLGTGIGSFKYVHAAMYPQQAKVFPANDPHNAYIYAIFELGLIGILIYIAWLYAVFRFTETLPKQEKILLQGVWLVFVVMGFTDSGLALNAVGLSFVLWISLYLRRDRSC